MSKPADRIAVIYCRVSSVKQTAEGDGLASQETRCREYTHYKGLEVVEIFRDPGASGGLIDRPGMKTMLAWLRQHRKDTPVVIIDDISRLARGIEAHMKLRAAIGSVGARLESPSIEFGEDSDSLLVENLLASVAQHQREKNGEQTQNRMRARLMNGYWVFHAPIGYRYERVARHGKMLVPDEPVASALREALEGFASGRFASQAEVKRFLEAHADYPATRIHPERIRELLTRLVYAGYVEHPRWGIHRTEGKHEGLIDLTVFNRIQKRLADTGHAPARQDLDADFPLRGFVTCGDCGQPMTACWSEGRSRRYPYYFCYNRACESRGKSVNRDKVEAAFDALLADLRPAPDLLALAEAMFRDLWDSRMAASKTESAACKRELKKIDAEIDQLMDRVVGASDDRLLSAYERRIRRHEDRKAEIADRMRYCGRPLAGFDESFRSVIAFLQTWQSRASSPARRPPGLPETGICRPPAI